MTLAYYLCGLLTLTWITLHELGLWIAPRHKLRKADAIVVLGGTRGQLTLLHEKIDTVIRLYKTGLAPFLISHSLASAKVSDSFRQNRKKK